MHFEVLLMIEPDNEAFLLYCVLIGCDYTKFFHKKTDSASSVSTNTNAIATSSTATTTTNTTTTTTTSATTKKRKQTKEATVSSLFGWGHNKARRSIIKLQEEHHKYIKQKALQQDADDTSFHSLIDFFFSENNKVCKFTDHVKKYLKIGINAFQNGLVFTIDNTQCIALQGELCDCNGLQIARNKCVGYATGCYDPRSDLSTFKQIKADGNVTGISEPFVVPYSTISFQRNWPDKYFTTALTMQMIMDFVGNNTLEKAIAKVITSLSKFHMVGNKKISIEKVKGVEYKVFRCMDLFQDQ
eukprot:Pgem_evm1s19408